MTISRNSTELAVIDDDGAVLDSLSALLTSAGFRVHCYASAHAFLEAPPTIAPTAIILDLSMPGLSGLDLAAHLRAEKRLMPIILISGRFNDADLRRATRLQIDAFLEKPFTDEHLLSALEQLGI